MSLEDYIPDEGPWESGWASAEKAREAAEKFKEQVRKASAWIKRTQKDEKKAKKQDMLLANFLVKLIIDKRFDKILELLFKLIDKWYPSNFLLWILSLIYLPISDKIREISQKSKINFDYKSSQKILFDEKNIDFSVQKRINSWVEDIILACSSDYSSLLTNRLIELLEKKQDDIIEFTANIFAFFLKDINIEIKKQEAINIVSFILNEVLKNIKNLEIEEI